MGAVAVVLDYRRRCPWTPPAGARPPRGRRPAATSLLALLPNRRPHRDDAPGGAMVSDGGKLASFGDTYRWIRGNLALCPGAQCRGRCRFGVEDGVCAVSPDSGLRAAPGQERSA